MLEQTHLKCHQNTVPHSALSQTTSSAHLQVPERRTTKSASRQHMEQSRDKHPIQLEEKFNPGNVLVSEVIMLWPQIQTGGTRPMMPCKLFHFTPCWIQNGARVFAGEENSVIHCDSYQQPLVS